MEDLFVWSLHKISIYSEKDVLIVNPSMRYLFVMSFLNEDQEPESIDLANIKHAMELIFLEEGINPEVIYEYLKHIERECLGLGTQYAQNECLELFSERLYFYAYWPDSKISRIVLATQSELTDVHTKTKSSEDQFLIQISRWWKENGNDTNNIVTQVNYELKITVEDGIGESYRRIVVPSNYSLSELYRIIVKIFHWSGNQQHRFLLRKKNNRNSITSNYYGMDIEAVLLDGFDMLAEDFFPCLELDHIEPRTYDTEVMVKDIFRRNQDCVHDQEKDLILSYGSEGLWVPRFYLHRIEFIHVVLSNEKLPPTLLESSGLRPPEVFYCSMEYYINHKFVCDESCISFHEGTDSYVEIMEPRRSLEEVNQLLQAKENSLGISYRGLVHYMYYQ